MKMRRILFILFFTSSLVAFNQQPSFVRGELLIQLQPATDAHAFIRSFDETNGIAISELEELNDLMGIYRVKFQDPITNLEQVSGLLLATPEVLIVQKNHLITQREVIPDDPQFVQQWFLKNSGADAGIVDADIDATDAWEHTTGGITTHGDTIVVCIIEGGGVDITHVDLVNNIWKNYDEVPDDGIDNDLNGYVDDYNGWNVQSENDEIGFGSHGTRVAGMVGASGNNGVGVSGVNWKVKMMIIKGQEASDEASVIAAYSYPLKMRKLYNESYGTKGAFVVVTNSSWGINNGDPADSPLWCAMYDTMGEQGILSVGATTNSNLNVDETGDMPTNCTSPYFIGVTSSNNVDLRAGSGYGTTSIDLAAPGNLVRLPVPGDIYSSTSGTSFASPCVAGAVALTISADCPSFINFVKYDPAGAALQLKEYILDGVDLKPALSSEVLTGGRLNVNNSIELLLAACDTDACIPPYNVRVNEFSDTSALIEWEGFSVDYIVTLQRTGGLGSEIVVLGGNTITFDTLKPCTSYTLTIQADCDADGLSDASFPLIFETDGCCKNPELSNPVKTENSLEISWPSILYATEYKVRYSVEEEETWTELEDVTSPLTLTDLIGCTNYEVQIYTVCDDSTRGYSESAIFTTQGCGVCTELEYCGVIGANNNLEWIDSIFVNGYSNGTGENNGWLKSEQIITALTPGESYSFRIKPAFTASSFTERYSIYIDFNQNGVFDGGSETVVDDFSILGTFNQTISIPGDAIIGVTKIRIGMSALAEPIACPTEDFYGEYEDYCVYVGPQLGIVEETETFEIYPNPANNSLFFRGDVEITRVQIYGMDGKLLMELTNPSTQIDIENLSSGNYLIHVFTENEVYTKKFVKN
jgi:serine protease